MQCIRYLVAFAALALLCSHGNALRDEQAQAESGSSRKLLQPFDLGLPLAQRRSGNVGNTGERRTNALSSSIANQVDTGRAVNNTIRARTTSTGQSTNLNFGGVGKTSTVAEGETTNTTAATITGVDVRSIALPGPGLTAARVIDRSESLAAERLKPAGPQRDPATLREFEGPNDDVFAGAWEVLGAGASDYGFAGDYDYAILTAVVEDQTFVADASTYSDDDYGRVRPVPETAAVSSRTRSNLNNPNDRAAGFGRLSTTSTGYNTVARGAVTTSGIWGNNAARFNDDIIGTGTVFVPPVPFRSAGGAVAGVGLSKNYRGNQLPGAATNLQTAGSTVSRRYVAGGAADQVNYAHGTQGVSLRSQNVANSGSVFVDFDAGRRRLQTTGSH